MLQLVIIACWGKWRVGNLSWWWNVLVAFFLNENEVGKDAEVDGHLAEKQVL